MEDLGLIFISNALQFLVQQPVIVCVIQSPCFGSKYVDSAGFLECKLLLMNRQSEVKQNHRHRTVPYLEFTTAGVYYFLRIKQKVSSISEQSWWKTYGVLSSIPATNISDCYGPTEGGKCWSFLYYHNFFSYIHTSILIMYYLFLLQVSYYVVKKGNPCWYRWLHFDFDSSYVFHCFCCGSLNGIFRWSSIHGPFSRKSKSKLSTIISKTISHIIECFLCGNK